MNRLCVMADVLKIPNRGQTWATNNLPAGFLDLTDHWTNTSRNIGVIMELNLNRIRTIKKKSAHYLRKKYGKKCSISN